MATGIELARRVARNASVQTGGYVASKIASLGFYAVMARELGQQGFGDFTFAASLVVLVEVAALGTDLVLTREMARDPREVHRLFWNVNAVKLFLGPVVVLIAIAVVFIADYPFEVQAAVAVLALAGLVEVLTKTVHATFRGLEDMVPIALAFMLQRFSTAVVGGGAMILGVGLVGVTLIYLGGAVLALAYIAWTLVRRGIRPQMRFSPALAGRLAIRSLPLGLSWTIGAIVARLDAVLLSFLQGNVAVGLYGAAYRIYEATLFLSSLFGLASLPALSRLGRTTRPTLARAYETGCKVTAFVLFPIGTAAALFPDPVIRVLYGETFSEASSALRLLGAAIAMYGFFILSAQVLLSQDRRWVLLPVSASVLALNAGLNLVLIPVYSFNGAAAAMTLSQAALTVATVVLSLRVSGKVSWWRVMLAPVAGCLAMAAAAIVLGGGAVGLLVAAAIYPLVLLGVERRAFPDDMRLLMNSVRRRQLPSDSVAG